ncbi:MAG TPA: hypothetical protein VIL71_09640 [Spirillospora sp.]
MRKGARGDAAASSTARAVALRAALDADPPQSLSPAERALLAEWLDRIVADRPAFAADSRRA